MAGTDEEYRSAMERALRVLTSRPRTVREVGGRLSEVGYSPTTVVQVLARLGELGYLDDLAFARRWIEERSRLRPVGRRALRIELARKGVGREAIEAALASYGEQAELEAARELARKLRAKSGSVPAPGDRQRCYAHLVRRGFEPGVAVTAVEAAWAGR